MIAVIGLGFVGLTTGLGLAHITGHTVYGYDINERKRGTLLKGQIPFYEPSLQEHLELYHKEQRFHICATMEEAVQQADIIFFCVGTPAQDSGEADLSHLKTAIVSCLKHVKKSEGKLLVIKSTVPPSTTSKVILPTIESLGFTVGKDIGLVNNPEFLREGFAWDDFIHPDRIVIGECHDESGEVLEKLYKPFQVPIHRVSANTGEYIKYLSNAMLATMISFSNEMSMVASHIGDIDVQAAFRYLHQDKRWNGEPAKMSSYVYPGCGFGGYCLPKDTAAVGYMASRHGYDTPLLHEVLKVNEQVKAFMAWQIMKNCDKDEKIGILGLSFKPGSDDVRCTPSKDIIEILLAEGYEQIMVYDPLAMESFRECYGLEITYAKRMAEVVQSCEVIALLTACEAFTKEQKWMDGKRVVDGRYCLG